MRALSTAQAHFKIFWGREEALVLGGNLAIHLLVQAFALLLMPFAYFSELSLHDGHVYYTISQNLWPEHPFTLLSWHKRILLPVLANLVYPWDRHVSFLIIGVGAASLSAVFFYKIAQKYTRHPLWLAAIYSLLPWLFFSAHLSLNEPLLMLFLLAGYYYYTEDRPWAYTACFALALLSKEVAAIPLLAMTVLIWQRYGWKRAALFAPAVLPFGLFCLAYGLHWKDCLWCARTELENALSMKTGLYWMILTLQTGTKSSANPVVAYGYDLFNQLLNLVLLAITAVGIYHLRRVDSDLMLYNLIISFPLLFLSRNQYMLNSSLGRQFLISALVILGFDGVFTWVMAAGSSRLRRAVPLLLLAGMLGLGVFWIALYSKFFLFNKLF